MWDLKHWFFGSGDLEHLNITSKIREDDSGICLINVASIDCVSSNIKNFVITILINRPPLHISKEVVVLWGKKMKIDFSVFHACPMVKELSKEPLRSL